LRRGAEEGLMAEPEWLGKVTRQDHLRQLRATLASGESLSLEDQRWMSDEVIISERRYRRTSKEREEFRGLLNELQWRGPDASCPACRGTEADGHTSGCPLARAILYHLIKRADGPKEPPASPSD
jgi:hypothetical protein